MKYVALKLRGRTLHEKLSLARSLARNLTDNAADFPDPDPAPQDLTDKADEIEAKEQQVFTLQTELGVRESELADLADELDGLLTGAGGFVQAKSRGAEAKITRMGLGVRNAPLPITSMGRVLNVRLAARKSAGEVKAIFKPVYGARCYEFQINTDPNNAGGWKPFDTSSISRAVLEGLPSGVRIWIRVRAVGGKRAGKGPWSDVATVLVP